jgi:hypothetical protein
MSNESPTVNHARWSELAPFAFAAIAWAVAAVLLCWYWDGSVLAFRWMLGLWALCLLDLFAIAKTMAAVIAVSADAAGNRPALLVQASTWGAIKLACLGLLGILLFRGQSIPSHALLLGLGTLVVVPLIGGLWWSQRALRHA